jgi:hypothetical protein
MGLECSQEEEEGSQNTQPTTEDLDKSSVQVGAGVKSEKAKGQWGPVLAQRKSKRFSEDSRTMLEKAQDFKKQCNLEAVKGIKPLSSFQDVKVNLTNVADRIGIVSRDGNPIPHSMLDNMVSLDEQRVANFQKICKDKAKVCMEMQSGNFSLNTDKESSSSSVALVVQGSLGGCSGSLSGTVSQPIVLDDTDEGWTPAKLGRRKRKKNKK